MNSFLHKASLNTHSEQKLLDEYIGRRIREKRQKLNYTLSNIAESLGMSHQQIQKYEHGQSRLNSVTLHQFAEILGVDVLYFYKGFDSGYQKKDKTCTKSNVIIKHNPNPLNVLVIENDAADEQLIRRAIADCSTPINLLVLHDGQVALEFLRNKKTDIDFPKPDVVLTELTIPKINGKELLKEMKRDQALNDIPVIILTNSIDYSEMKLSYKMQSAGFICKNCSYSEFLKDIDGCMHYWSQCVVLPYREAEDVNMCNDYNHCESKCELETQESDNSSLSALKAS